MTLRTYKWGTDSNRAAVAQPDKVQVRLPDSNMDLIATSSRLLTLANIDFMSEPGIARMKPR